MCLPHLETGDLAPLTRTIIRHTGRGRYSVRHGDSEVSRSLITFPALLEIVFSLVQNIGQIFGANEEKTNLCLLFLTSYEIMVRVNDLQTEKNRPRAGNEEEGR